MLIEKDKPTMIWELTNRGFGSELNNLLYAINYCEKKSISIRFLSDKWNNKIDKGWIDFFKQTPESVFLYNNKTISSYNRLRSFYSLNQLRLCVENKKTQFLKSFLARIGLIIFNFRKQQNYLFIHDYFKVVHEFNKEESENDKDLFVHKMNTILKGIWKFNEKTIKEIRKNKLLFKFSEYAVFHIRRGDKLTTGEDISYSLDNYIKKIVSKKINTVFVMSDDYRVYEDLVKNYPKFNFYTLIDKNQRGHFQSSYNKLSVIEKEKNMVNLLTEIEIAKESNFFVGSANSNIFRLIEYFKIKNCINVSNYTSKYDL